jgi:peptide/nickel transport system permease protein
MSMPLAASARLWRRRAANRAALVWIAGAFMLAMLALAALAPVIAPGGYEAIDLRARLQPPALLHGAGNHILGTDDLGRDVLARLAYSIRVTVVVALTATLLGALVGTAIGLLAAAARGWVDHVLMLLVDFQASLPYLILVLAVIAAYGNNLALFVVLLGLHGWQQYARLARGQALSVQAQGYAVALTTLGCGRLRLYLRHVLPNIAAALIVNATLAFPQIILLESSLSFLGLGIQPPQTSLGNMVGFGRAYLMTAWWIAAAPAAAIFLTSLSFSILGDHLRDRLDPTLRRI